MSALWRKDLEAAFLACKELFSSPPDISQLEQVKVCDTSHIKTESDPKQGNLRQLLFVKRHSAAALLGAPDMKDSSMVSALCFHSRYRWWYRAIRNRWPADQAKQSAAWHLPLTKRFFPCSAKKGHHQRRSLWVYQRMWPCKLHGGFLQV